MANPEHVEIVKQGAYAIAKWRRQNVGYSLHLSDADLSGAKLNGADLSGTDMSHAFMNNVCMKDASLVDANLTYASLKGANLNRIDLRRAMLSGADLNGANLSYTSLGEADLSYADLRDTHLDHADLRSAFLSCADLSCADLTGANLSGANVSRANLGKVSVRSTMFVRCNLTAAVGLETVKHGGPSSVDTQTLTMSKTQLPAIFLRGCGFSPWEVEMAKLYNPDLTAFEISEIISTDLFSQRTEGPLYIGGVFISYSHADSGIADKLYKKLQKSGVSVWLDRHDMVAGDINRQVGRELRVRDIVVLILSEDSVKSDWVEHELTTARQKEKDEDRDVFCPISVDDSWQEKTASDPDWKHLRKKLVLDFSQWKTKAFSGQFDKLLKGMKINYEVRK